MQPSIGRVIHYVDEDGRHRMASVLSVEQESFLVRVLEPAMDDYEVWLEGMDEDQEDFEGGTWHWPEQTD